MTHKLTLREGYALNQSRKGRATRKPRVAPILTNLPRETGWQPYAV